ncbi:hypothetical protein FAZ95_23865 [Trinickia violacea]|uniref:Phage tail protein n=1 Tax=Trinickia violacea TaxID=2571746 RepID=A0A4V1EI18_9BURK|nr:hypothetical protein [Trinickia violacea]QCP52220.1 hypothetical protein FAZ95_23865 [Trinickia violacea]
MNLQEQIGALETGVDQLTQLIQTALAQQAAHEASAERASAAPAAGADSGETAQAAAVAAEPAADHATAPAADAPVGEPAHAVETVDEKPTLHVARPAQNEIVLTVGGQSVSLHPDQVGELIEELANARASMVPEPPTGLAPGWRFVSTKNPVMAVQKQSNGDRLLVLRHTGHGWVPFTFSPDMAIQLYMMLTQR